MISHYGGECRYLRKQPCTLDPQLQHYTFQYASTFRSRWRDPQPELRTFVYVRVTQKAGARGATEVRGWYYDEYGESIVRELSWYWCTQWNCDACTSYLLCKRLLWTCREWETFFGGSSPSSQHRIQKEPHKPEDVHVIHEHVTASECNYMRVRWTVLSFTLSTNFSSTAMRRPLTTEARWRKRNTKNESPICRPITHVDICYPGVNFWLVRHSLIHWEDLFFVWVKINASHNCNVGMRKRIDEHTHTRTKEKNYRNSSSHPSDDEHDKAYQAAWQQTHDIEMLNRVVRREWCLLDRRDDMWDFISTFKCSKDIPLCEKMIFEARANLLQWIRCSYLLAQALVHLLTYCAGDRCIRLFEREAIVWE